MCQAASNQGVDTSVKVAVLPDTFILGITGGIGFKISMLASSRKRSVHRVVCV